MTPSVPAVVGSFLMHLILYVGPDSRDTEPQAADRRGVTTLTHGGTTISYGHAHARLESRDLPVWDECFLPATRADPHWVIMIIMTAGRVNTYRGCVVASQRIVSHRKKSMCSIPVSTALRPVV